MKRIVCTSLLAWLTVGIGLPPATSQSPPLSSPPPPASPLSALPPSEGRPFPGALERAVSDAVRPQVLYRLSHRRRNPAEMLALVSLQGLLARTNPENVYLDAGASGFSQWLRIAQDEFDVEVKDVDDPWGLLERFRSIPSGFVFCDLAEEQSVLLASSLAGPMNAVVVDASLEQRAKRLGWKELADARGRDFAWYDRLRGEERRPPVLVMQRQELVWELKDFAALTRADVLSSSQPEVTKQRLEELGNGPAVALGWGDTNLEQEDQFVRRLSGAGTALIPADYVRNLSVLAGLQDSRTLQQSPAPVDDGAADKAVHTVTFIFTDGDNLGWLLNDFSTDRRWFGSPERGKVPLGWGVAPSLATLFPAGLDWYYRKASAAPSARDVFVAGPSGNGYFFPSKMTADSLDAHTRATARAMRRADLGITQVLDFDSLDRIDLWDAYTRHDSIDGIVYMDYAPYDKQRGRMVWSNGKPVISAAAKLWGGLPNSDPDSIVRLLNRAPRRSDVAEGYSIVVVHAWTHSVASVVALAKRLDSGVDVVAPDTFFRRVADRVDPQVE